LLDKKTLLLAGSKPSLQRTNILLFEGIHFSDRQFNLRGAGFAGQNCNTISIVLHGSDQ